MRRRAIRGHDVAVCRAAHAAGLTVAQLARAYNVSPWAIRTALGLQTGAPGKPAINEATVAKWREQWRSGMSQREIAERAGVSESTVQGRLARKVTRAST